MFKLKQTSFCFDVLVFTTVDVVGAVIPAFTASDAFSGTLTKAVVDVRITNKDRTKTVIFRIENV